MSSSPEKKNKPAGSNAGLLAAVSSGISMFGNAVHRSVNTLLGKEGIKVISPQAGKEKDAAATDQPKQEEDKPCNVVFKVICSDNEAKAVIGKGGSTATLLQNESGAFIRFTPIVDGHRIATISAMEDLKSYYSQTQNAMVRIVAKLVEVAARESCGCVMETPERITVRLLITPAQADRLLRDREYLLSEIRDVEIELLEGDDLGLPSLATDKILWVSGEYMAVQNALLRVTKELRDDCFSSSALKREDMPNNLL